MLGLELTGPAAPNAADAEHREGATRAVQGLTITDEELVVRSVNGDVDSFNQLIRRDPPMNKLFTRGSAFA